LPQKHIVDRYMETLSLFDVQNDNKGLDYFLSEEDQKLSPEILRQIPERFITLAIGAQHFTKKAPPEKLAAICDKIHEPVVILGGTSDESEALEILRLSSHPALINLCGKLSLNQSAFLVKRSELVITHDTGILHIAAAFKKRIISLWGNTIPEFGMYPYLPHPDSKIYEVKGLACRPCSKIGFQKCPKNHFRCMMDQDVEAISETINLLVGK